MAGEPTPPDLDPLREALASAAQGDISLPRSAELRGVKKFNKPNGLHLFSSPTASGKTTMLRALHLWLRSKDVKSHYAYIGEPRAPQVGSLFIEGAWEDALLARLKMAEGGFLLLDSLTYLVSRLRILKGLDVGDQTYKEGLTARDIMGVLIHDSLAFDANVAVIATVNSDLLPRTGILEGACEGSVILMPNGSLNHRDRSSRRWENTTIPSRYISAARADLGYGDTLVEATSTEFIGGN
jgi:hypothetical protein